MSYYGVLVLSTILVTSLVAFYLLYKAKELNLGVVISISIGSIILGFTFSPAFKAILKSVNNNININNKLALIISLLLVLFVFLLFILIVSFIISICMPKKLASIDCCVVIERIIAKIKDGIISIKEKLTVFFGKIVSNIQEIVKNVYKLINKLKKPVDTKQIIDTMGIEKDENGILGGKNSKNDNSIDSPDFVAFANLIGFMEPSREEDYETQDSSTYNIEQTIDAKGSDYAYDSLAAVAYQEIVTTQLSDIATDQVDESVFNELSEIIAEDQEVESKIVEIDIVESEISKIETAEEELSQTLPSDAVEFVIDDDTIGNIEHDEGINESGSIIDANSLVVKAFESKDAGRKEDAIECYIEALQHEPNNEMIFWIVLDVCALYKQLGLSDLAKIILEGLVSKYEAAIQPEVKMEIMNYLK